MTDMQTASGLILAAGRGTRFRSEPGEPMPKLLRPVLARPMVAYVIDTLAAAGVDRIVLVVGYRAQDVISALGDRFDYVLQEEQKGSGHAVRCAARLFQGFAGPLIVMCGDSPLFRPQTVREMVRVHEQTGAVAVLASAVLDDPTGYGRIVRDGNGLIVGVVEEKCASEREQAIKEVNGGAYVFDGSWLFANIDLMAENEAGEYNLTDMVRVAIEQGPSTSSGCTVDATPCHPSELLGINTPEQSRIVEDILRGRQTAR